jgi:BirA family biotin operon repressor/biotin-[acetyl-CoA-carboxylase] ligase
MNSPQLQLPHGYRLVFCETVGSTNDEAKDLARGGAAEGTIVWALAQTAGRGRRGRTWASPPGNLYVSLVLRPQGPPDRAAQLGFAAALAVADALADLAPGLAGAACKWPNDVLIAGRKIAGILLESEMGEGAGLAFLVLGIGINLASAPSESAFPATSLVGAGYPPPAPKAALEAFARHFDIWARRWRDEGFAPLRAAWLARAAGLGGDIRVRLETGTLHGKFVDLDRDGRLLLEMADGLRHHISAGDVFPAG